MQEEEERGKRLEDQTHISPRNQEKKPKFHQPPLIGRQIAEGRLRLPGFDFALYLIPQCKHLSAWFDVECREPDIPCPTALAGRWTPRIYQQVSQADHEHLNVFRPEGILEVGRLPFCSPPMPIHPPLSRNHLRDRVCGDPIWGHWICVGILILPKRWVEYLWMFST